MSKEIVLVAATAIISIVITILVSNVFVVPKNEANIDNIKNELADLKKTVKTIKKSIANTNIFIAQAHPDMNPSYLVSMNKLGKFSDAERKFLSKYIKNVHVIFKDKDITLLSPNSNAQTLKVKYDLDATDILNYKWVEEIQEHTEFTKKYRTFAYTIKTDEDEDIKVNINWRTAANVDELYRSSITFDTEGNIVSRRLLNDPMSEEDATLPR